MDHFHASLAQLASELVDGPPGEAFMLNPGDPGLLRSLQQISAADASRLPPNGAAPVAAHVDHLCYGLELLNRWSAGEQNPWSTADWTASWKRTSVTDEEWSALKARLRDATSQWQRALAAPREMSAIELNGVIGSVAHLAYHLGSIRQIDRSLRGPHA